jgi:hypothetical protein
VTDATLPHGNQPEEQAEQLDLPMRERIGMISVDGRAPG